MIKVIKEDNKITMTGHSVPEICAGFSSVMYTCVNVILEYDKSAISFQDVDDVVTIEILKHDRFIDIVVNVMMKAFEDLHDENRYESEITIKG